VSRQGVKDHDVVEAVEELGPEKLLDLFVCEEGREGAVVAAVAAGEVSWLRCCQQRRLRNSGRKNFLTCFEGRRAAAVGDGSSSGGGSLSISGGCART
jgi:hypothetical protein